MQGHPGTIYGLTSSLEDQFVSSGMNDFFLYALNETKNWRKQALQICSYTFLIYLLGEGGSVILWDAAARKAKWSHVLHGEIVNCVTVSTVTGKLRYYYDFSRSLYLNITQYEIGFIEIWCCKI